MHSRLDDRRATVARFATVVATVLTASCAASDASGPSTPVLAFTAVGQLQGTVGQAFTYSFCKPDLTTSAALCGTLGGGTTSPSGGQPSYHFQLGSGVGFPPAGLALGLNGILSGTPTTAGTSTFSVCAVDLAGDSKCGTVTMTIVGTVRLVGVTWSCQISATPLPGWRNCTGTATLSISKVIQSGYVSVFFNYPSSGAFFHGELAVTSGGPAQTVTVNVVNDYVSQCVTSYSTQVDVYDGRQNSNAAPLLVSTPVTLTSTCQ